MYDEKQLVSKKTENGVEIGEFIETLETIKSKNPNACVVICGDEDVYFHVEKDGSVVNIDNEPLDECYPNRSINEFVGQVIDIFEDFLDTKKIVLENDEKLEDVDVAANIYGADYGVLQTVLEDLLENWKLVETDEDMGKNIISK